MCSLGRFTLAIVLLLAPLSGCDGRGGSSGFDLKTENAAISRALATQQCLDFQGLRICPAGESTTETPTPGSSSTATPAAAPSIDTDLGNATSIDCFQAMPGGSCTFTLRFVAHAFSSDTTFKVLSRADASSNPWVLGPNPVLVSGGEASTYDATLVLASVQGGSPNQVQLAVLAFAGASASSATEVQELNQTAATFAFVTQVLTVNVVTPTMTPTPTARPTNTPTPTRTPTATSTPGANDCCQCASSCAVPVGGMCDSSCTVIFGASCYGELLCTARTPTPTLTPSPTVTPCLRDNGDGTISDGCTGLMWEKKDQAGGLHDFSASYPWAGQCDDLTLCQPDAASATACYEATNGAVGCSQCSGGSCEFRLPIPEGTPTPSTTIWGWLVQLNQGEGFAGYTDWRIPTVDKEGNAGELETILLSTCTASGPCVRLAFDTDCPQPSLCDASHPCSAGRSCVIPTPMPGAEGTCSESGCTVTSCSCTWSGYYWSATSDVPTSTPVSTSVPTSVIPTPIPLALAYFVDFSSAYVLSDLKMLPGYLRAVRGRKTPPPTVAPGAGANDCCQCPSSCAAPVDGTCGSCAVVVGAACDGGPTCSPHTPTPTPTPCLQDNGDGTITDGCTGLTWEKKDQAGGLHDYGALYTWAGACTGNSWLCQPNAAAADTCAAQTGGALGCAQCATGTCIVDPNHSGAATTIWDWLSQLNSSGFAGYNDWQIPGLGGDGLTPELDSILAAPWPCSAFGPPCVAAPFNTDCISGCDVTTCSCTRSAPYWCATSLAIAPGAAWEVDFTDGGGGQNAPKTNGFYVRAVRGGP
jgi:hypothetical protein